MTRKIILGLWEVVKLLAALKAFTTASALQNQGVIDTVSYLAIVICIFCMGRNKEDKK